MTSHLKAFLAVAAIAAVTVSAQAKPYEINGSYVIVFAPVATTDAALPTGAITVVAESGNWIQIQYSTFKNERSKSEAGKVESVETAHKAWVNLDHVAAFLEPVKSK